jgi:hypothetical protein
MDEQMLIKRTVKKYQRLDEVLKSRALNDEEAAFLRGRMLELMSLIHTLDEHVTARCFLSQPRN